MMNIKEKKDMDDAFKKAQKPWAKLLQKVEKTKNDYHTACKTEKSAANQERNAAGDSSLSADQVILAIVVDRSLNKLRTNFISSYWVDFGECTFSYLIAKL